MRFTSADGQIVVVDDAAERKLAAHPGVIDLLPDAVAQLTLYGVTGRIKREVDMGRVLGETDLVDTPGITLDTETLFAYRAGRKFPSHVTREHNGTPCQTVALSLLWNAERNEWDLVTAFVGKNAPNEPFYYFDRESWFYQDEKQYRESLDFWMSHALTVEEAVMSVPYTSTWRAEIEKMVL